MGYSQGRRVLLSGRRFAPPGPLGMVMVWLSSAGLSSAGYGYQVVASLLKAALRSSKPRFTPPDPPPCADPFVTPSQCSPFSSSSPLP